MENTNPTSADYRNMYNTLTSKGYANKHISTIDDLRRTYKIDSWISDALKQNPLPKIE